MSDFPSIKSATDAANLAKPKLPRIPEAASQSDLKTVAKEFEAMFMNIVSKAMRQTVETSELFKKSSQQSKVYQQMLDSHYASMSAERKQTNGIAEMLLKQLEQRTGAKLPTAPTGVPHED